jgi:hypothetical protein
MTCVYAPTTTKQNHISRRNFVRIVGSHHRRIERRGIRAAIRRARSCAGPGGTAKAGTLFRPMPSHSD